MADLGQVTVRLRAETAGFQQQLTGVSAAIKRVESDVRQAGSAYEKGTLDLEGYQVALRQARREAEQLGLTQKSSLLQGISSAELGITDAQLAMTQYGQQLGMASAASTTMAESTTKIARSAGRARQGLGTIRSSAASLTARMIALNGTVGTFSSGILQFAAGNAVAIGIIAGIAGIAAAIRHVTREAREAAQRAKDWLDQMQRARHISDEMRLAGNIQQAREAVARYTEELAKAREAEAQAVDVATRFSGIAAENFHAEYTDKVAAAQTNLNNATNILNGLLHQQATNADEASRGMRTLGEWYQRVFDVMRSKPTLQPMVGGPGTNQIFAPILESIRQGRERDLAQNLSFVGETFESAQKAIGQAKQRMFVYEKSLDKPITKSKELAVAITAITLAANTMRNALEKIRSGNVLGGFLSIIGTVGGALIGNAIPGLGALPGAALGGQLFGEPAGQTHLHANFNVTVPPPQNYWEFVRDKMWQKAFRDSALIAEASGFRLRRG